MRFISLFSVTVLIVLPLLSVSAKAETIPEVMLQADYDSCAINARKNKNLTDAQISSFCLCAKKKIGEAFTLEEYLGMAMQMQVGGLEKENQTKLNKLTATCIGQELR